MYFLGLQTIDNVCVPEGENREFCQSCLLTGRKEEPVVLRRAVETDEEMSLNTGGAIGKSLCFLPLWWVKVVYK